jgi:hypothetical protein
MSLCAGVLIAILFYAVLLGAGARVFGAALGSPARGAAAPLIIIPLATDWMRFALHLSPAAAFAAAAIIFAAGTMIFHLTYKPAGPFSGMRRQERNKWLFGLILYLALEGILRTWLFTGNTPNPADDTYSGYKANAIIHSPSWPTMLPEAPELPMAYYYYVYEWPAAFASLAKVPLLAGWWVTAIVFCTMGAMLLYELILPALRTKRDVLIGALIALNGSDLSFLAALALGFGPKNWALIAPILGKRYGLYLHVTGYSGGYWSPFAAFAMGLLLVSIWLLWQLIREQRLSRGEYLFVLLSIASLAGYCTFDLIGLVLAIMPVLTAAAVLERKAGVVRRWVISMVTMGMGALLLSLPVVALLIHRAPGARQERFKDPLLVWLHTGLPSHGYGALPILALWTAVLIPLTNPTILPVLWRRGDEPEEISIRLLMWIFGFGTFVCLFGVMDDFEPKFGGVPAGAAILAFYQMRNPPKWSKALLICGLIGPSLVALDTVRANLVLQKVDPVWRKLDAVSDERDEVVLYDVPRPPLTHPRIYPYFSRAQFLAPVDQIDDQARNFMVDPAQLATLPPTAERVRELAKGAPTYLLLRSGTAVAEGEELYRDQEYSIDRVPVR